MTFPTRRSSVRVRQTGTARRTRIPDANTRDASMRRYWIPRNRYREPMRGHQAAWLAIRSPTRRWAGRTSDRVRMPTSFSQFDPQAARPGSETRTAAPARRISAPASCQMVWLWSVCSSVVPSVLCHRGEFLGSAGALRPSSGRSAGVFGDETLGHAFTLHQHGCAPERGIGVRRSIHGHRFVSLSGTWRHLPARADGGLQAAAGHMPASCAGKAFPTPFDPFRIRPPLSGGYS